MKLTGYGDKLGQRSDIVKQDEKGRECNHKECHGNRTTRLPGINRYVVAYGLAPVVLLSFPPT